MLVLIGLLFLVLALFAIYYNKSANENIFDAIIDSTDPYVDKLMKDPERDLDEMSPPSPAPVPRTGKKSVLKGGGPMPKRADVPLNPPTKYDGELEEPESRGKGGMKNERRCRRILEDIFKVDFPTVRPNWLKNPGTKRNLEIDCYNHALRIGLEYSPDASHGALGSFHKTRESLIYQIRKDQWKVKRCKELGITLVVVPSWATSDLKGYITRKLTESGKMPKL